MQVPTQSSPGSTPWALKQDNQAPFLVVMAARVAAIHVFGAASNDVDCMLASPAEGWDAGGHPGRGLVFSTVAILRCV